MNKKYFNTTGPINPDFHYHIPPLERMDLDQVMGLIRRGKYFALHAPRQSGKTSFLRALRDFLHDIGEFACLQLNLGNAVAGQANLERDILAILATLAREAKFQLNDDYPDSIFHSVHERETPQTALQSLLMSWTSRLGRPLVLLLDETDALKDETLYSVLSQLRTGYEWRGERFPHSVLLCGVRDVTHIRPGQFGERPGEDLCPFNVLETSLRLENFQKNEVARLLMQHTKEAGQRFQPQAIELMTVWTGGQPWLVNKMAEIAVRQRAGGSRGRLPVVTAEAIVAAQDYLINSRDPHFQQFSDRLIDARVRKIVERILAGDTRWDTLPPEDLDYVLNLGLVVDRPRLDIANPIYREVIPRALARARKMERSRREPRWQDGATVLKFDP
ncbi:ATP-binding protein [Sulfidibacter corallicola]|uniref:ATP-binding protein n=1 Tax=Sulfidibacter corallicola TaxID=2818388 RepID=A0A8A4TP10_SULCO|nr:AAA-like domain-containing protein [Sulfidibacter corallicola]QTD51283.1 ATP-binding protein [Sulfidibacter corallicola]